MAGIRAGWDSGAFHERLGVVPIINAAGSITRLGGSRTRPETLELMSQAARVMVNIDDLNRAAGKGQIVPVPSKIMLPSGYSDHTMGTPAQ